MIALIISFFENTSFLFICRMRINPENGLLYLLLVKSTHLFKAYKKTKEIVVSKKGFVITLNSFHEVLSNRYRNNFNLRRPHNE